MNHTAGCCQSTRSTNSTSPHFPLSISAVSTDRLPQEMQAGAKKSTRTVTGFAHSGNVLECLSRLTWGLQRVGSARPVFTVRLIPSQAQAGEILPQTKGEPRSPLVQQQGSAAAHLYPSRQQRRCSAIAFLLTGRLTVS
jgi:hypothetical protein